MTDLELLDRYRIRGDKAALDRLVERYYSFVLRVCRRQLRNNTDADDAAQQVFGHLLSHAPQVHTNVAAWLHRCAHNVSVSLVRSQMARRRSEQAYVEYGPRTHDGDTNGDLLVALDECLATMPDHDRELIIQTQLLRVPQRVMAEQRGVSQQAVAKQVARSLDRLRVAISARGFAITAVALAAALESEASATLVTLGAAAAAPHLVTTTATTLATATKLQLLGTAVASVVLLSLPGTSDHMPVAAPHAALAPVAKQPATDAPLFVFAPPAQPQPVVEQPRNTRITDAVVASPRENRRGGLALRPNQIAPPVMVPLPRTTVQKPREVEIAQSNPNAQRGTPLNRDLRPEAWPRLDASRWNWGGLTATPIPPVGAPLSSPVPIAAPTLVQHPHGSAAPGVLGLTSTAPPNAAPGKVASPIAISQSRANTAMASAGGSAGGGSSGVPRMSNPPNASAPPPSGTVSLNGLPTNVTQIRGQSGGTSEVYVPPHSGTIVIAERPDLDDLYVNRSVAPHGGPPVEQLAHVDNFVLTLENPKSMPVIDVPRMVQLSAPMLRTASAIIESDRVDSHVAEALIVPLDAHDVATLISDCVTAHGSAGAQGSATTMATTVADRSGTNYGAPGVSPEQLMLIVDHDSDLPGHADVDAGRIMSIHKDFANVVCMPLPDGTMSAINRSIVDGSSMVAVQLSTVPEPAAWQIAALAAALLLLVLLAQRFRRGLV